MRPLAEGPPPPPAPASPAPPPPVAEPRSDTAFGADGSLPEGSGKVSAGHRSRYRSRCPTSARRFSRRGADGGNAVAGARDPVQANVAVLGAKTYGDIHMATLLSRRARIARVLGQALSAIGSRAGPRAGRHRHAVAHRLRPPARSRQPSTASHGRRSAARGADARRHPRPRRRRHRARDDAVDGEVFRAGAVEGAADQAGDAARRADWRTAAAASSPKATRMSRS